MIDAQRRLFIEAHTELGVAPLTPEVRLWLATEATALWEASEAFLAEKGLPPPFWAFAWAGGQALARYVLDRPETVDAKRVLDFGAGGGLVAIAAMLAGAKSAVAADVDAFAATAARLNAAENDTPIETWTGDATRLDFRDFDVILAADVCYERAPAAETTDWLRRAAADGVDVLMGDPGRSYFAGAGFLELARYDVPTPTELERLSVTPAKVWRVGA